MHPIAASRGATRDCPLSRNLTDALLAWAGSTPADMSGVRRCTWLRSHSMLRGPRRAGPPFLRLASDDRVTSRRLPPPWSVDPLSAHILTADLEVDGRGTFRIGGAWRCRPLRRVQHIWHLIRHIGA
jgi:hypothetical protein